MSTLDKHLEFVKALHNASPIVAASGRISIEQKFHPYFRTFILIGRAMEREELNKVEDIATTHGLNANPFRAGSEVTSITFTDTQEQPRS